MNEMEHDHHHHKGSHSAGTHPSYRPYWKRAHCDWRLWVVVLLMLAAMMTYVMTNDFAFRPAIQSAHSLPNTLGR